MDHKICIVAIVAVGVCGSSLAWAGNVYVLPQGKKYHAATCPLIHEAQVTEMDENAAKNQNRKPCKKCLPDGKQDKKDD